MSPQASHHLYSFGNQAFGYFWLWKTPVQPQKQRERFYLFIPVLIQESTSIAQHLQLWKSDFRIFLVLKDACTTSTRPPRQLKRVYQILPALKQQSMSIKEPVQLWKTNFKTFLIMKDACTTPTTVRMISSSSQHWIRSRQASHHLYSCGNWALRYF